MDFQPYWIKKFKKDLGLHDATFGVLVTEVEKIAFSFSINENMKEFISV
jgi:hypothetical protein